MGAKPGNLRRHHLADLTTGRARALAGALGLALAAVAAPLAGPLRAHAGTGVQASQVVFQPVGATVLSVDGAAYRGQVVLAPAGGGLAVVDRVGFEDYVAGIAEVPPDWPPAALAAQAVAARTYALWEVLVHPAGAVTAGGGQICATDSCQVYAGIAREQEPGAAAWLAAVRGTADTVLLYQGRVIEALYGSSDGGRTVSGGVPWLPSVSDPEDSVSPEHHWTWSEPLADLAPVLGVPAGSSLVALVSHPDAIDATVQAPDGTTATSALAPDSFHSLLNSKLSPPGGLPLALPSWRYSVSTEGSNVVVDGYGFGHGMGMSQYGALGKALRGWNGAQILAAYYGPAAPVRLAPGQEPATIGVALADGVGRVRVSASGPFRILDGTGRVLASVESGAWDAVPSAGRVEAALAGGSLTPPTLPAPTPAAAATGPTPVGSPAAGPSPSVRALSVQPAAPQLPGPDAAGPLVGSRPAGRGWAGGWRAALAGLVAMALLGEGACALLLRRRP